MVVSFSSQCLLSPCPSTSFLSKSSKTIEEVKFTPPALDSSGNRVTHICKQNISLRLSTEIRNHRPRSSKYYGAFGHSAPKTDGNETGYQNDLQVSEKGAAKKQFSSLKTLIKAYKDAILEGDEKTLLEIETEICSIENEKNRLIEQVAALKTEVDSGKQKYVRLQADFDNFRKRSDKDRLNTRSDAQGEVIESLLLMVDSFERAKQQIKPETEKEVRINASYQGIYKQFVEIMRSLRVSAVPTVGKPFDPSLHEAIAREESQEFKEGIVIQELRRGFLLGERLLRPAMVKVSAGPGVQKARVASETTDGQPAGAAGIDE